MRKDFFRFAQFGAMLGLVLSWVTLVHAQSTPGETDAKPHEVVKQVTDSMMTIISAGEEALAKNPDDYYASIRQTLEPTVSFPFIARNVMAGYWKTASDEQKKKFVETFTQSMVQTLGKGMANYSDLNINTLAPEGDVASMSRVEVVQEIKGVDGTSRVSYTMAKNGSGEWKLINVVLNGVNLGKSFRDQFAQAMKQNEGDMDKVIANWSNKS